MIWFFAYMAVGLVVGGVIRAVIEEWDGGFGAEDYIPVVLGGVFWPLTVFFGVFGYGSKLVARKLMSAVRRGVEDE